MLFIQVNISLKQLLMEKYLPMIRMCVQCIQENPEIEKPMRAAAAAGRPITHGTCQHHFIESELRYGRTKKQIQQLINQIKKESPNYVPAPYLKDHPDLLKKYKAGVFDEPVVK